MYILCIIGQNQWIEIVNIQYNSKPEYLIQTKFAWLRVLVHLTLKTSMDNTNLHT